MRNVLRSAIVVAMGMATGFAGNAGAEEDEVSVAVDKLPKAVVEAVRKHFPTAVIESATTEKEDDEVLFEVKFKVEGQLTEVTLEADGEIEEIERTVEMQDVPPAVLALVSKKFPKSTSKSVEAVYELEDGEEELEYYEVQIETADQKTVEVKVKYEVEILNDADDDDDE